MFKLINFCDFVDEFIAFDRDNFTPAGQRALFDYLERLEEDTGTPMELDVIALCCEYTEYASFEAFQADYKDVESMDDLEQQTAVIHINDDAFIIAQF